MDYNLFTESIKLYENNTHYKNIMCLNEIQNKKNIELIENEDLKNINIMKNRNNLNFRCCLNKNHSGNCNKIYDIFDKNNLIKKLMKSIANAIYNTPGNDDYVYKNRSNRLFPIVLSKNEELKIRNKNIKKKCAIPLKDASSPILLAQAYLDYMTFMINIKDINQFIIINNTTNEILELISLNKKYLINNYINRNIFNDNGYSICVITGNEININDVSNPFRDNRIDIKNTDIQLGHNFPRSENYVSIRGLNLLPMSREGNRIIGEDIFTENNWIIKLKLILSRFE